MRQVGSPLRVAEHDWGISEYVQAEIWHEEQARCETENARLRLIQVANIGSRCCWLPRYDCAYIAVADHLLRCRYYPES